MNTKEEENILALTAAYYTVLFCSDHSCFEGKRSVYLPEKPDLQTDIQKY